MSPLKPPEFLERAYPFREHFVNEPLLHFRIRVLAYDLIKRHLAQQNVQALTGSAQFVFWAERQPGKYVKPDVYVVVGFPETHDVRNWKVWEQGKPLDFALEVVPGDFEFTYSQSPERYGDLGVQELIIFDPYDEPGRIRWQVFTRGKNGLRCRWSTQEDRVPSEVLSCHFRYVLDAHGQPRVRLGVGDNGDTLVLTAQEGEARERAAKEAAQARCMELEAEMAALRAQRHG